MAAPGLSKRASRAGFTGRLHTCARAPPRSLDQELWGWSLNPHVSESHVAFCGERPGQVRPPPARVTCPLPPLRVRTCSAISVLWNTGTGAAWHGVRDKTALVVLPLRVLQGDSMPWVTSVAWSSAWCSPKLPSLASKSHACPGLRQQPGRHLPAKLSGTGAR